MSLNKRKELALLAKSIARELRKNSTKVEQIFWNFVRDRKLLGKKFLRQHPIFYDISEKESFFIADFYCHEKKLVVELDGEIHKYQLPKDNLRTEILNSLGLQVVRFKNNTVIYETNKIKEELTKLLTNSP
ncbi:MAG: endonuclease domain-containing protein [Ignavibacteriales bacterium]|nr:MAG: endonuclease domain-containing protein [Ignavibacteriales bacterium]